MLNLDYGGMRSTKLVPTDIPSNAQLDQVFDRDKRFAVCFGEERRTIWEGDTVTGLEAMTGSRADKAV